MNNISITDSRFLDLSNTIISNHSNFNVTDVQSDDDTISSLPKSFKACVITDVDEVDMETLEQARNFIQEIENEYDLHCMLAVYYPSDGFIGWHTNQNVNVYNAICTFSDDGNSFFEYIDGEETIQMNDNIGWFVKKSHWQNINPVPHRAVSSNHRITLTFASQSEEKIDRFIDEIT